MAVLDNVELSSGALDEKPKKHTLLWVLIAVVVLLCVVGGFFGKQFYDNYQHQQQVASLLDVKTFYPGIVVQGVDLGGKTMEQAKAEISKLEPATRDKYAITIQHKDKDWKLTEDDLTFAFNTDSVLKEAYSYAREGDREERYNKVLALKAEPKKYQITNTMSYDGLEAKLKEMVKDIPYAAVNATVASFNTKTATFQYADGKDGLSVDEDKLFTQVKAIIEGPKSGTVEVPTVVIPFNKSIAEVRSHLQKLGTFSTTSTNTANGTYNMSRALAAANGACVPAGGTFSFNATTGNCNQANGYREAGALLNGTHIQEYGGGICQASTTIYGAALRSNMVIVQRSNHTIPSTYCPVGQDATVSYPSLDFKFKNPTDYPVYIVTSTKGRVLTATFYGYQSPEYDNIVVTSQKTATIPAPTTPKYTVDNKLAKGAVRLDAKARNGIRAVAQRVFYKNGKVVKTENLPSSYYRPLPAYYSVGPGGSTTSSSPSSSSKPASSKPSTGTPSSTPQTDTNTPPSGVIEPE